MSSELDVLQFYGLGDIVKPIETSFAAVATIAPTSQISLVSGTIPLKTVTPPWDGFAGSIDLIFTDATPGTTLTTGNLAIASTPITGKALRLTYSRITGKWYPSY